MLKECPFCGGKVCTPYQIDNRWKIACEQFCVSMIRKTKKVVIHDWNTRARQGVQPTVATCPKCGAEYQEHWFNCPKCLHVRNSG